MTSIKADILIGGAGFAGMALALALARVRGAEIRVIVADRAPSRDCGGRASNIAASSRNMLEALGVWRHVTAVAQPVWRIEITDSSLDDSLRPVLLEYDNRLEGGEAASHIVPDAALLAALRQEAEAEPGVSLCLGKEIQGYSVDDHNVHLDLEGEDRLTGALLVAADGRRSRLREAAGIGCVTFPAGQMALTVTVGHERPHEGAAVQHFLPGGPFAILPLPGNRSFITWSEETHEAQRILTLDAAGLGREVERRFGGKRGALEILSPCQGFPLDTTLARSYVAERFVLIGDAAHGVHPIAGQGLNLAFRDVAALTEVLAGGARLGMDLGSRVLLNRYERWRRADSTFSALTYNGLNRLFSHEGMAARALRGVGLGLVDRLPGAKALLVREAAGLTGEVPRLLRGEPA